MKLASAILVMALTACSSHTTLNSALINRLKNRGPVALSSENPFLAANLLVSKEMETKPELQGFIKHRGAPGALEVESRFLEPNFLKFYYPENREYYTLEDLDGTWLIRGPFTIEREQMKEVARLTRDVEGSPKVSFPDGEPKPKTASLESSKMELADKASTNTPENIATVLPKQAVARTPSTARASPSTDKVIDELLSQGKSSPAEITPKGDLVHYVTYPGETLSMIARWYTFDRANVGRITRINKLLDPNNLAIGDNIIVPVYLVKNKSRLTPEAVKALAVLAHGESRAQ